MAKSRQRQMANCHLTIYLPHGKYLVMKLDRYLSQNGTKPSAFAATIGVSPSTITRVLKGERSPGFDLVMKIKIATGGEVTADDWYEPAPVTGDAA